MSKPTEEQTERIEKILANCTEKDVNTQTLSVFYQLLSQNLTLPCDVIGKADLERYILYDVENSNDDMYGLLGKLKLASDDKKECIVPLCDLKAVDNRSIDFLLLHDYGTWFVNYQF
jgi:hypothetical protein